MNPRLAVVSGPLEGTVVPIGEVLSIGRSSCNRFPIADSAIADRQCAIARDGDVLRLTHLGNRQLTIVNGLPVKETALRHGDHVKIGGSIFLVLLDREPRLAPCAVHLTDLAPGLVVKLWRDDVPYGLAETSHAVDRLWHELEVVGKIGAVLASVRGLAAFERPLLGLILEVIPADGAALLLAEGDPPSFESLITVDRDGLDRSAPLAVCRSLANTALCQRIGAMSNDVRALSTIEASPDSTKAALAVPLLVFERTLGVIYVEAAHVRFEEGHLRLLALIGKMASIALDNCRHVERLEFEKRRLHAEIGMAHDMVGDSPAMQEIHRFIGRVAPTDATVLIEGESGTGKELVARAIHRYSPRAGRRFVTINCAAITETLLESELFGHEKGAFTGAVSKKRGKLEVAHAGTVFLDEVAELSPVLQPKLLRVLEDHRFDRVGGIEPIEADIRVIAATNARLADAVAAKRFRSDLYYRLNVVSVTVPPLRTRREDIGSLAALFAGLYGEKLRGSPVSITSEAEALMYGYGWPGNVRELKNAIERAVVLGTTARIGPEDLPDALLESPSGTPLSQYHSAVRHVKRDLIVQAITRAGGNLTSASRLLGLNANYLHRLIRNMELRDQVHRPSH